MASYPVPAQIDPLKQLTDYVGREVSRRHRVDITADTPLVSSGLIDSFALIEVFLELQRITNRAIPSAKVRASDMDTVRLMISTAEKMGKPKP
jgi:acyl carrier protein